MRFSLQQLLHLEGRRCKKRSCCNENLISVCTLKQSSGGRGVECVIYGPVYREVRPLRNAPASAAIIHLASVAPVAETEHLHYHVAMYRYMGLRMRRECREHFPRHRLQRKLLVSDPDMYYGTCITYVPWCMSGSLIRGGGENVGACVTRNFAYLARGPLRACWGTNARVWAQTETVKSLVLWWKRIGITKAFFKYISNTIIRPPIGTAHMFMSRFYWRYVTFGASCTTWERIDIRNVLILLKISHLLVQGVAHGRDYVEQSTQRSMTYLRIVALAPVRNVWLGMLWYACHYTYQQTPSFKIAQSECFFHGTAFERL